jgi:Protein of unknown function (DUF3370)
MLPIFIAQALPSTEAPAIVIQNHPVRALSGQLDETPVFNSNSPEVLKTEGILLSTLSPAGKAHAPAHLNHAFTGKFDIFSHHIARPDSDPNAVDRLMHVGFLAFNPSTQPITLKILQALSYDNIDAPFIKLPDYVDNPDGKVFAGPGSRLANDLKRGLTDPQIINQITVPPGQSKVFFSRSIPDRSAKSTYMRLHSSGQVQIASAALFSKPQAPPPTALSLGHLPHQQPSLEELPAATPAAPPLPVYRSPNEPEWQQAITSGILATPRDQFPTNPKFIKPGRAIIYGRVAGVAQGSRWEARITDNKPNATDLSTPVTGQAISFALNTLHGGALGTGQIQSAPMIVRYPDTAHRSHGNYGTHYRLTMPLHNTSATTQNVAIKMQTPLKEDVLAEGLRFFAIPAADAPIYFRGTVQIIHANEAGNLETKRTHIVQRRGEQGQALVTMKLPPGERRQVQIELVYPPDASPPQVLTVESLSPTAPPTSTPVATPITPPARVIPLVLVPTPPSKAK